MAGGRYQLDPGEVIITSIREINFDDISEAIAKESGFSCLADLLKTAQHGTGHHIYFIRFYFRVPDGARDEEQETTDKGLL